VYINTFAAIRSVDARLVDTDIVVVGLIIYGMLGLLSDLLVRALERTALAIQRQRDLSSDAVNLAGRTVEAPAVLASRLGGSTIDPSFLGPRTTDTEEDDPERGVERCTSV
jgi:hypothetical protein